MEGILPIWKEAGMTSHDVVFKLRKILKTKKVGHSGTLDPDVDGVLPVAIGKATKMIEYMMDSDKIYTGEITLGYSTTTEDRSGDIVDRRPVSEAISLESIDAALAALTGKIEQTPPMYSAVKVNGKRLYEYARKGVEVERPTRTIEVHDFQRTSDPVFDEKEQILRFTFEVRCGKGTYVRTLAVDLGQSLGYPSHMSQLTRISSGGYSSEQAFTLAEVKQLMEDDKMDAALFPLESALTEIKKHDLTEEEYAKVKNGALLDKADYAPDESDRLVFMKENRAVAIYGSHPSKSQFIKPIKVLRNEL